MNRCREYEQDFIVDAFDEEFWFRVMNLEYNYWNLITSLIHLS